MAGAKRQRRRWPRDLRVLFGLLLVALAAFVLVSLYPTHGGDDCVALGGVTGPPCPDMTHELGLLDFALAAIVLLLFALLAIRLTRWRRGTRSDVMADRGT